MCNNIDELPESGRGLKLMWQLVDELSYTRTAAHQNCLLMVKRYKPKPLEQSQDLPKGSVLKGVHNFFNPFNSLKSNGARQHIGDTPLQKISLQVNTDLNVVAEVLQWYEQLNHLPIPTEVLLQCQLALVEGFTNAVRHAHKDLPLETPIELEIMVFNKHLEMKILDYGQPFDLKAKLREILTSKSTSRMKVIQPGC